MDIDVENYMQKLHKYGPGTREENGVIAAAEITSDILESLLTIEGGNISKYYY